MESIEIPYRVTEIGQYAFLNDVKLTSVTIPRRTATIATNAFSYPNILTIYGVAGTTAETYAAEIGATFVAIDVPATAVSLNQTQLTMSKGASATLVASITPTNFTDEVAWKSSNTSVATVTDAGVVKAVGIGECTISFVAGNVKATCKVSVVQPVTSISLNKTSLTLDAGTTYTLTATVNPSNAANKAIVWSSDNEKVATVDPNGVVTALSKGTATITVAAQDGSGVAKTCKVTVLNNLYVVNSVAELQSPHPYNTNANDVWQHSIPGANALEVTFGTETSVEEGSDYIYIYSKDGTLIGAYTGAELAGKTITVPGDTVKIKIVSDGTYCEYGFCVTSVKAAGEAHTHSYTSSIISPTCTDKGYTLHTCSCGDSYKDNYTAALGHAWDEGVVTTEPTENEFGIKTFTCTRCAETRTETIPPLNHTHAYSSTVIAPTCTEEGYTVYSCACGDSYIDNYVAALGHDYNVSVTAPTCTESGYSTYTCSVCNDSYISDEFPTTGHNYSNGSCLNCGKADPNATITNPFADVKEADYFYTPVLWAVQNGITTGTSATTFEPNSPCTRGQIVTFLWRACGSPEPTSIQNPFTDVKSNEYYYKAVLWAVEEGITTGISATKFGPTETCTRGQVATFLWRAQGKPAPTNSNNPFSDVKASDYYYEAVLWAVENNITNGTGVGKFSPNDSCTRGQIVTFLYRALA